MTCAKCGALAGLVEIGDYYESHEALHCWTCGKVEWINPVPPAPPEKLDYLCDLTT